ncbi:MAG TPA: PIN domain-containing protein [Candidatus Norongarragalinales archaeon]|nr:PIN domain-containing protein [Candidatus Norongarragalinales archaeon]
MDRLFLDTSALVELFRGTEKGRATLKEIRASSRTFTSPLNLYKLWYLAARERGEKAADNAMHLIEQLIQIALLDTKTCLLAARLKSAHKGKKLAQYTS